MPTYVGLLFMLLMLTGSWHPIEAHAQLFPYGGSAPQGIGGLSLVYKAIDFDFAGTIPPDLPEADQPLAFEGPAFGLAYTRPNLSATVAYGSESRVSSRGVRVFDATVIAENNLIDLASSESSRLYVPVLLLSNYRRAALRRTGDSIRGIFSVTVLGLGTGLGWSIQPGGSGNTRIEGRATPVLGIALRSFGDSTGSSWLLDADVHVHRLNVFGRLGLSIGYGFRFQAWNLGGTEISPFPGVVAPQVPTEQRDLYDYSGSQHVVSLGLNW